MSKLLRGGRPLRMTRSPVIDPDVFLSPVGDFPSEMVSCWPKELEGTCNTETLYAVDIIPPEHSLPSLLHF